MIDPQWTPERAVQRVLNKIDVDVETGCWISRRIPDGLTVDHICKTPKCVNPSHLRLLTAGENSLCGEGPPARNARKTHCLRGHPFDEANTYINSRGARCCRTCNKARWQKKEGTH